MARQARPDATGDSASGVTARSADRRERSSSLTSEIAALMAELDGRPPARWIERILTLRREGRQDAADALLREFQRRYPDEPLPLQK